MSEPYFITTAIDYVNGRPHLGHAYEKVLTDVLARHQRAKGKAVFFLTGVDEHGMKVQQSAQKQGRDPQAFCDEMAGHFQGLYQKLEVSFDDFVRTTQPRHKAAVQAALQKLFDAGEIYAGEYEGYYSPRQEQFLTEKEKVDGKFPEIYGEVVLLKETNYFFKLSKYQDWLVSYLRENPDWIFPSFRTKEVLGALEQPIPDLCISRPKARLSWGIPLPFDPEQVTYVWFDALVNYISVIGYDGGQVDSRWPAVHVIGKDILVPPHAIYWPIMLKALGLAMPRHLIVHGFWTRNQEKMAKSVGNVVDPLDLIDVYGVDAFRYFVMREMALGQDADFSAEQFHQRYESELANSLGNLVNRAISMLNRYRGGVVPETVAPEGEAAGLDADLKEKILLAIRTYRSQMDGLQIHLALMELWKGIARANQYVEECAPWKLAKDPAQAARLDQVLARLAEALLLLGTEISVLLPCTARKIGEQLGTGGKPDLTVSPAWPQSLAGTRVGEAKPLFPKVETEKKSGN
jgi:methionyl-tRNA synthetase